MGLKTKAEYIESLGSQADGIHVRREDRPTSWTTRAFAPGIEATAATYELAERRRTGTCWSRRAR